MMQDKIAIVLPVRDGGVQRHKRLIRCLESYKEITEGLSDIFVLHDEDECDIYHPILKEYPEIFNYCIPTGLTLMQKINVHALDIANKYKYIGFIGDDIVFKTPFEKIFIENLSLKKIGMVYGNDLIWKGKLPTHPFMTSNVVLAVGFFGLPAVKHNFFDNYWADIFSNFESSITYFPNVVMEHMHSVAQKESRDYINQQIQDVYYTDQNKYATYVHVKINKDVNKILNYVHSEEKELK